MFRWRIETKGGEREERACENSVFKEYVGWTVNILVFIFISLVPATIQTNFFALAKLMHLLASAKPKWEGLEKYMAYAKEVWVSKKSVCDVGQTLLNQKWQ